MDVIEGLIYKLYRWIYNLIVLTHTNTLTCPKVVRPTLSTTMPLISLFALGPFEKWRIDFVGPIAHAIQNGHTKYLSCNKLYLVSLVTTKIYFLHTLS